MKIELKEITIRELAEDYQENDEAGVVGFGGKLDIRPPYQREFIYKDKQRDAVIDTASKNFPLNVMYWAVRDDGNFEIIDGQQRTISLCQYVEGDFSVQIGNFPEKRAFHNLQSGPPSWRRYQLDWWREASTNSCGNPQLSSTLALTSRVWVVR